MGGDNPRGMGRAPRPRMASTARRGAIAGPRPSPQSYVGPQLFSAACGDTLGACALPVSRHGAICASGHGLGCCEADCSEDALLPGNVGVCMRIIRDAGAIPETSGTALRRETFRVAFSPSCDGNALTEGVVMVVILVEQRSIV